MCIQLFEQRSKWLLQGHRLGLTHNLDAAGRAIVVNLGAHDLFSIKKTRTPQGVRVLKILVYRNLAVGRT